MTDKTNSSEQMRETVTAEDREIVLGLIAWLQGAAQGDRPNTTRGEAAAALQRILSTPAQAAVEPIGYIDRKDIARLSNYKAIVWPGTNEIDAVAVYLAPQPAQGIAQPVAKVGERSIEHADGFDYLIRKMDESSNASNHELARSALEELIEFINAWAAREFNNPQLEVAQPVAEAVEWELPTLPKRAARAWITSKCGFAKFSARLEDWFSPADSEDLFAADQMRAYARAAIAQSPARQEQLNGGRPLPFDREELGRMVRQAWVEWAQAQPSKKPSWLVPYDQLSESDKEADRQIGEFVARWTLIADAVRHCDARNSAQPQPGEKA